MCIACSGKVLGVIGGILLGFALFAPAQAATVPAKIFAWADLKSGQDFWPYSQKFDKGVSAAVGDVNGDGLEEIVTISGSKTKTHLRVFDLKGSPLAWNIFPFEQGYTGGGQVAIGDVDGDDQNEIIVVPLGSRAPEVLVYKYGTTTPAKRFTTFQASFRGGLNVATGDLDDDSRAEIIVGTASRGGNVAVYDGAGKFTGRSYFPFGEGFKSGVSVAAGMFSEGRQGIVMGALGDATSRVKVYAANEGKKVLGEFLAYGDKFHGGVNVAAADVNADGEDEIITAVASNGTPHVLAFNLAGRIQPQVNFFPFNQSEHGGVNLAASSSRLVVAPAKNPVQPDTSFCQTHRCVALTFDDGGSRGGSLEKILDTLDKYQVKGTFFLIGRWMDSHRSIIKEIYRRGHRLGNHTWNHSICTRIPDSQIVSELAKADSLVELVTGQSTKPQFRFPGGVHDSRTVATVLGAGYHFWQWTADPRDAMGNHNPASIKTLSLRGLHNGSVLLFHTGNAATAAALDGIIAEIKRQGYELVTVDQMEWQREKQW